MKPDRLETNDPIVIKQEGRMHVASFSVNYTNRPGKADVTIWGTSHADVKRKIDTLLSPAPYDDL